MNVTGVMLVENFVYRLNFPVIGILPQSIQKYVLQSSYSKFQKNCHK